MNTLVQVVDSTNPSTEAMRHAAELLTQGELVAFPTETVYGLGADALSAMAVDKIFTAKGRPAINPIIVHVLDEDAARRLTSEWPSSARELVAKFWPGPLTFVLPKRDIVPDNVTAGGSTVAVRSPAHPVARLLLQLCGRPLAAPSANASMQISPTTATHVLQSLDGRIPLILDGGSTANGLESTVLDLSSEMPRILRPGTITKGQIEAVIGPIADSKFLSEDESSATDELLRSPGLLRKHYSPMTKTECVEVADSIQRVLQHVKSGHQVGWIQFGATPSVVNTNLVVIALPENPAEYSRRLYAALHELDQQHRDVIIVTLPPAGQECWEAPRDRILRAAAT